MQNSKRRRVNNSNHDAQRQAILPPEILCEILARLPMDSVIRCRSVCKSWYRMTKNPYFVNLQLNISRGKPSQLIIQSCKADLNRLYLLDIKECKVREVCLGKIQCRTRFKLQLPVHGIRSSCDGLLCMAPEYRLDPIFVCNPITRECVILPFSTPKSFVFSHQLGFGFDQSSGKYKVIREYTTYNNLNASQFQIITLGESSWRQLSPPQSVLVSHDAAVFWNGSLHWIINDKNTDESILAFNLSDEEFYTIPFPRLRFSIECYELMVLDGCLTVVEHDSHIMKIWEISGNQIEGFSIHYREEHDTYVCWNKFHYYTTICRPTCNSFFIRVRVTDSKNVKKDWFRHFVPKIAEYFHPDIHGLPDHFNTVHFKPSFVSPVAATLGSKSVSVVKERLNLVSSEWESCFGYRCPKPSKGTLTSLFFNKWRWA